MGQAKGLGRVICTDARADARVDARADARADADADADASADASSSHTYYFGSRSRRDGARDRG